MTPVLLLLLVASSTARMRVPQIRLPSSQHVKYMPIDHDRPKVTVCPAPSSSSSGGGFNLWTFLTSGVVAATVVANIVDNVNDNNNNNNNNNNQDNQNTINMNFNNNANENMNENMVNMAMGRQLEKEGGSLLGISFSRLLAAPSLPGCTARALCEASNSPSPLGRALQTGLSLAAGLLLTDWADSLRVEDVVSAVQEQDCQARLPCSLFI